MKIISGGQTGVDRGALEAALAANSDCGGWCPAGRRAEDGAIPARFPVRELGSSDYATRTRRNVEDSDATLIIGFGPLKGGTRLTRDLCRRTGKLYLVIDGRTCDTATAVEQSAAFVTRHGIEVLNVAGPRESYAPGAAAYARTLILELLSQYTGPGQ